MNVNITYVYRKAAFSSQNLLFRSLLYKDSSLVEAVLLTKANFDRKSLWAREKLRYFLKFTDFRVEPDARKSRRLHILIDRALRASIQLFNNESILKYQRIAPEKISIRNLTTENATTETIHYNFVREGRVGKFTITMPGVVLP